MPLFRVKTFKNTFRRKALLFFTVFTTFLIITLCVLFVIIQTKKYTEFLFANGKLYAGVLAKNSRLGIFSGNREMLDNAASILMNQKSVMQCSIFDTTGRKMYEKRKKDVSTGPVYKIIKEKNKRSGNWETEKYFFFWDSVITRRMNSEIDFFNSTMYEETIGFVCVIQGKQVLEEQLATIRNIGVSVGLFFFIAGLSLFYYAVTKFTNPLHELTEGVKSLDSRREYKRIRIHDDDEVGELASAFNKLTETLKKREVALNQSRERLRSLSEKLIYSQEDERKRLSYELHDELGQSLAILKHNARYIGNNLDDAQSARENCENMISYIDEIIENVRRLSRDLSPSIIEDLGLREALKWMFENFATQHKISVSKKMSFNINMDTFFSKEAQTNIYRLLQEVLTNIIKHSGADVVQFSVLEFGDSLVLSVIDNGVGFEPGNLDKFQSTRGIGLTAMEERARMLGADLSIKSTKGKGTEITITVPVYKGLM